MSKYFYIIGTERSGSNLLRLLLDSHSKIAVPHPPHFLKNLASLESKYGDLKIEENFDECVRDCLIYLKLHPYQWPIRPSLDEVKTKPMNPSLIGIQSAIYSLYSDFMNKELVGCKSTFCVRHCHEILSIHPDAKFIHLVRDPRDVVVSAKDSQFNYFHAYFISKLWQEEQVLCEYLKQKSPQSIIQVRYEDLITNTENILKELTVFLGMEFENQMLQYHTTKEAKKSGSLSKAWENTSKPVLEKNRKKYISKLSQPEILICESLCFPLMDKYNYPLENDLPTLERKRGHLNGSHFHVFFWMKDRTRMFLKQLKILATDKNNHLRIAKYWFVKWLKIKKNLI